MMRNENMNEPQNPQCVQAFVSGCSSRKFILHLCADLGSDSLFYQLSDEYEVIMIGEEIGVENYHPPKNVHGIIANPVCTEFSTAKCFTHVGDIEKGMFLVNHCLSIIELVDMASSQFRKATDEYIYESDLFDVEEDCGSGCVIF